MQIPEIIDRSKLYHIPSKEESAEIERLNYEILSALYDGRESFVYEFEEPYRRDEASKKEIIRKLRACGYVITEKSERLSVAMEVIHSITVGIGKIDRHKPYVTTFYLNGKPVGEVE